MHASSLWEKSKNLYKVVFLHAKVLTSTFYIFEAKNNWVLMCCYTMIFHNFWYISIYSQIWFGTIRSQYSWIFGRLRHTNACSPGKIRQNQASFASLVFFSSSNNMYSPAYKAIPTPSGLFHFCVKSICRKMYSWPGFMMLIFKFAVSFFIHLKHFETSFHCELNWTRNAFDSRTNIKIVKISH